jgi:hypothetical protein
MDPSGSPCVFRRRSPIDFDFEFDGRIDDFDIDDADDIDIDDADDIDADTDDDDDDNGCLGERWCTSTI